MMLGLTLWFCTINRGFVVATGIVKFFDKDKGWGFLVGGGVQYFCHFKQIKMEGFKNLIPGESVEFEPEESPKGPVAKNIRPKQFNLSDDNAGNY